MENKNLIKEISEYCGISAFHDTHNDNLISVLEEKASSGLRKAMYYLGLCYQYGIGVDIDQGKAYSWLKKSTDQIYEDTLIQEDAMLQQGYCYLYGIGVNKNLNQAIKIFESIDSANAYITMGKIYLYLLGIGIKVNQSTILEYFQKAIYDDVYNNEGLFWHGLCLLYGIGGKQDKDNGIKEIMKSALYGNKSAAKRVFEWYDLCASNAERKLAKQIINICNDIQSVIGNFTVSSDEIELILEYGYYVFEKEPDLPKIKNRMLAIYYGEHDNFCIITLRGILISENKNVADYSWTDIKTIEIIDSNIVIDNKKVLELDHSFSNTKKLGELLGKLHKMINHHWLENNQSIKRNETEVEFTNVINNLLNGIERSGIVGKSFGWEYKEEREICNKRESKTVIVTGIYDIIPNAKEAVKESSCQEDDDSRSHENIDDTSLSQKKKPTKKTSHVSRSFLDTLISKPIPTKKA